MLHSVHLQVVGVIAAALEKHAAHALPSQTGTLGVGMQAASGISEATAAQQADHTASAASVIGDVTVIAMEVRCRRTGSSLTFCEAIILLFAVPMQCIRSRDGQHMCTLCLLLWQICSCALVHVCMQCTAF